MNKQNFQPRMNSIYRVLILSLLNDGPKSGYDLIQCLTGIMGSKPSHGKIYPFLNELQKFNIITQKNKADTLRGKVVYKLTSDGHEFLISTLSYLEGIFYNFLTSCSNCGVKYYTCNPENELTNNNYCCDNCETATSL